MGVQQRTTRDTQVTGKREAGTRREQKEKRLTGENQEAFMLGHRPVHLRDMLLSRAPSSWKSAEAQGAGLQPSGTWGDSDLH